MKRLFRTVVFLAAFFGIVGAYVALLELLAWAVGPIGYLLPVILFVVIGAWCLAGNGDPKAPPHSGSQS